MNGTAFRIESSAPLITPLRRIADATVTTAIAAPMTGSDRDILRDIRAPPQRATRCVMVMSANVQYVCLHEGDE